jgi:general stress protein 26
MEEITDEQLMVAERRECAQAALEGFVLCMIVSEQLTWDENVMQGKWFYQSESDPDLVLLRTWVEGK